MVQRTAAELAPHVRAALQGADLEAFGELLDPGVTWGAPGDPSPSCQNRRQVLTWYRQGRAAGRRAQVLEVTAHGDRLLVAMTVVDEQHPDRPGASRWQVLTVAEGRVCDIRGYDDEAAARAAAGLRGTAPGPAP